MMRPRCVLRHSAPRVGRAILDRGLADRRGRRRPGQPSVRARPRRRLGGDGRSERADRLRPRSGGGGAHRPAGRGVSGPARWSEPGARTRDRAAGRRPPPAPSSTSPPFGTRRSRRAPSWPPGQLEPENLERPAGGARHDVERTRLPREPDQASAAERVHPVGELVGAEPPVSSACLGPRPAGSTGCLTPARPSVVKGAVGADADDEPCRGGRTDAIQVRHRRPRLRQRLRRPSLHLGSLRLRRARVLL